MSEASAMTPQTRILHVIGGNFTPDALGAAYDEIRSSILADPELHMRAFEQEWLEHPDRTALTDLYLPSFLALIAPALPDRAREAARKLAGHMARLARTQEAESHENLDAEAEDELGRQRRQLLDRQHDLDDLVGR